MIKGFWNKETEYIFKGFEVKIFSRELNKKAHDKLVKLNYSPDLQAIGNIKGNRLEKKEGRIKGAKNYPNKFYTIWVTRSHRIAFTYKGGHLYNVLLIDYH